MIHMSTKSSKRNVAIVVLVVVVIAAIAGGYYFTTISSPSTQTTSMEQISTLMSETSSTTTEQSMMTSETMTSATTMASVTSSVAGWQPTAAVSLLGAGATFPQPLIQKWTVTYNQIYPDVTISYSGIGSGGGIQQITIKTVDFGASDAPLSNVQLNAAPGLVLFPETLGGVAVTYNLAAWGIPSTTALRFTSSVIAGIYMGTITHWNDPALVALNPGINLPTGHITAVHRSDGSGTTFAFTNFLSVTDPNWASQVGYSTSVTWPVDTAAGAAGVGAKGNPGVAGTVANTNGAIGYVDLIYAIQNNLGVGAVENAAGNWVQPTLQTILWAAANATGTPNPKDLRLHIVNAAGPQSYPIATYTYLLVYQDLSRNPSTTLPKAQALAHFFWWAIHDGQQYSTALAYVPLPANVVSADEQLLMTLNYQGTPLLP
jgi:phosphate transport system substrate-binding protein